MKAWLPDGSTICSFLKAENKLLLYSKNKRVMLAPSARGGPEMAKGQVKSNKETRKPKKDKVAEKAAPAFGSQVKSSESTLGKKK
ncbi:hypothetical protein QO002_002064 [Pararhizobium capsulatum DSM 1112]|uniref:Uncharacterized protein n=1 Tax=Pararhizobium capsulatum DSM 1112 TaxID=1121113 RepID=A0ABU0BQH0_9HYPH|nr:hypothetical protein [Pararhizobium capsulatum]MDQ0319926.1 hypothetical protein [Pararhizobium capsulatum DSM 1112]